MPLQATSGAASYDGFGGGVPFTPTYIEDVFSTYLYTGNGSTQTITNGIDLSTKGGLVWTKRRNGGASGHRLVDTVRGAGNTLYSNLTNAAATEANGVTGFTSSGYSIGTDTAYNFDTYNFVSWTFREQAKFFDVVTYTGNGSNRTIAHSLGSVPGCILVKRRDTAADWQVYHRSIGNTKYLLLNSSDGEATNSNRWNNTTPTSTDFALGTSADVNANGGTYVAYLFAHDAGGFGLTGTDNVITCGSFTTDSLENATVTLGYEPQWVLMKNTSSVSNWILVDNMRGMGVSTTLSDDRRLFADLSGAEGSTNVIAPTATGFVRANGGVSQTWVYIAIRRGPMKTPTSGTSVYSTDTFGATTPRPPGFKSSSVVDLGFYKELNNTAGWVVSDRLRGPNYLEFNTTAAAQTLAEATFDYQNGWYNGTATLSNFRSWMFTRAPGFFDVVCYTGTSSGMTISHNLGVTPQIVILKCRDAASSWFFWSNGLTSTNYKMRFTSNEGESDEGASWISVSSSSVTLTNGYFTTNNNVMYLFATVAGVSKVGTYTGSGTTNQIDCGFTNGARFVLIKRRDNTGDWYVWDSARGIVSGNDPYLLLNSTAAEVTSTDYIDTYSAGFEISSTAPAAINANGGSYIFLAIA